MASNIIRYGNDGVNTVEGNVAGSRAAQLTREREKQKQEYEKKKADIQLTHQRGARIDKNFQSYRDDEEAEFKVSQSYRIEAIPTCHADRRYLSIYLSIYLLYCIVASNCRSCHSRRI
jgi:hypothetical protein